MRAFVLTEVHLAHAACAELLDDLVGTEGGADHGEPLAGTSRFNFSDQFVTSIKWCLGGAGRRSQVTANRPLGDASAARPGFARII